MNYLPEHYENEKDPYDIGYVVNFYFCHLYNGDTFKIENVSSTKFSLIYDPVTSNTVDPSIAQKCKDFWDSVELYYSTSTGILSGAGTDQFSGGGYRPVSIALDRSVMSPFKVHVYVGARIGGSPPEDGSATGTGR